MANVYEPHWDAEQDRPPFTWKRSRVGRQAGCERLGASVFELPPGAATFPLHIHHANEELIVVLSGRPTLRDPDGERELSPGDAVACPPGPRGAHRLDNHTDEPARVLIVSTMVAPEVTEYPDSGKVGLATSPPGGEGGIKEAHRRDRAIDYFDGETDDR